MLIKSLFSLKNMIKIFRSIFIKDKVLEGILF